LPRFGESGSGIGTSDDDRAARRTVLFLAVAGFVAVIAVVLRLTLSSLHGDAPSARSPARAAADAKAAPSTVTDLGPTPGVDLVAYARNRRAALSAASGDRVAVTSLNAYATESQARALTGSLRVVALLVAAPEAAPAAVTGSLLSWAGDQTAKLRDERNEISKLLPTVTDAAFKDFYTSEIDRLDKAAMALSPSGAIVFGIVVRGPASALQALGARPEVRLVDVGEGSEPGARAAYRGLRPEERTRANEPLIRPAA